LCIDKLPAEFFWTNLRWRETTSYASIVAPFESNLLSLCLSSLARILGKLSGRSRELFNLPPQLSYDIC
jgi:hypothetical protein